MNDKDKDIGQLASELEGVKKRVPAEGQALLERCGQVARRISAAKGLFSPKRGELDAIWDEIQTVRKEADALAPLYAAIRTTRAVVEELCAEPSINASVDAKIEELCEEWLPLLDHIARAVGDSREAGPALEQVNQLREWARRRRQAAQLIRSVSDLNARAAGNANAVLADVERTWIGAFSQGRVDEEWLKSARNHLQLLRTEFSPERHEPRQAEQSVVSPAPVVQIETQAPPGRPVEPEETYEPPAEEPSMMFFRIATALTECSDLARALGLESTEISEFEMRMQDIENDRGKNSAAAHTTLKDDVEGFQKSLQEKASAAKEERLQRLRRRWKQFQSIYADRQYATGISVQRAEELKSDSPARLTTFFESVREAIDSINFTAESDRPPLAQAVRRRVEMCTALLEELRRQPRTIAIDTSLGQQERRIPKAANLPGSAESSFECLDVCDAVLGDLASLKQANGRRRQDVADRTEHLRKVALLIDSTGTGGGGAPAVSLIEPLSADANPSEWLDQTEMRLGRIEQALETRRKEVQQRVTQDLVKLRKENLAWSRVLVEFSSEAESLGTKAPPPQELEALRDAFDLEVQSRRKIEMLARMAAELLARRKEDACAHLDKHLASPAFETHPERDTAESLLDALKSLVPLPDLPDLDSFSTFQDSITDAESFVDRLEASRREIPGKIGVLQEQFSRLNEQNVVSLRPEMANRIRALLQGLQEAIDREEFDSAEFQLGETERLIVALECDARSRISAETRLLEQRLKKALESADPKFAQQARVALGRLEDEGHLEPPSYSSRTNARRVLNRNAPTLREAPRP